MTEVLPPLGQVDFSTNHLMQLLAVFYQEDTKGQDTHYLRFNILGWDDRVRFERNFFGGSTMRY